MPLLRSLQLCVLSAGFLAASAVLAAAVEAAASPATANVRDELAGSRHQVIPFKDFGINGSAPLRGVQSVLELPFGVRLDEVAVKATLHLQYSYSPSLLPELSHIKVILNDQVVQTIALPTDGSGSEQIRDIELDPRFFTDYNHLKLILIAHYTRECEDALHTSLWASISDGSRLDLQLQPLALKPDLALLPSPFFDRRDGRPLNLPIMLPASSSPATLEAAGVMSSWFGALAGYRGASFPVAHSLPQQSALVLADNNHLPSGLGLQKVQGPSLSVVANPVAPQILYLVLQGRDAEDLRTAAQALALGQVLLSGQTAQVNRVVLGAPRPAYDAPNWLPSDRPVKFSELIDNPAQLQVEGHQPQAVRVNLMLAPDLLTWNRAGVPIDLKYRFTPPTAPDNSSLTFTLNEQLVRAFRLKPDSRSSERLQLVVPLLNDTFGPSRDRFLIPAFQIGSDNQMQFRFVLDYHKLGVCTDTASDAVRAGIDPDSTVDVSELPHYVRMPDLALFGNASWPFSKYADLAQTAVVVPDAATDNELLAALNLLGRMGRHTGVAASRVRFVPESKVDEAADHDLLIVGGGRPGGLLTRWASAADLGIDKDLRSLGPMVQARLLPPELLYSGQRPVNAAQLEVSTDGPLAAVLGFESPLKAGRSVIALLASSDAVRGALAQQLLDPGIVGQIRGDTVIVRGDQVAGFDAGRHYFIGQLPWLTKIRLWLAAQPWIIVLMGVAVGLLLALWLYSRLRNAALRRLEN